MTDQPIGSVSGSEVPEPGETDRTAARTIAGLAIVVGTISLALTVALLIPYYALQNPWIIPVFVVAAAAASANTAPAGDLTNAANDAPTTPRPALPSAAAAALARAKAKAAQRGPT